MSTTVDNRAVQMEFNNKQFESGVKTTVESLDTLKKGLQLDDSAKSLGNLSNQMKTFSLGNISEGVQNISSKFSILGAIGFTVLNRLTNAAIDFGRKMVQNVLTPMKQGFQEYETQMNAIQTVLANTESKGTTLKDVNAALNELNTYADKTIYNFTEMTRNIGTFTAAGVSLETSVAAIKGIANLAAVSGSNSQQASVAMYQLSQALSSGTVKLMDWNSVVNAGMGGQVFQEALKETARVHGVTIDKMIESEGSFRETLQNGWLTSEILLDTLKKFTGDLNAEQLATMGYTEEQIAGIIKLGQTANDAATKVKTLTQLQDTLAEAMQSGWTQSWTIIIGDFEEAKELFTFISDTFGNMISESANARNALLQGWKDLGGRELAVFALKSAFEAVLSIMAPIKEAFREIFPPTTAKQLLDITGTIARLIYQFKLSSVEADKVKRIFKGLFAIFDIIKDATMAVVNVFFDLADAIPISGSGILDFLANIGDYIVGVRDAEKSTNFFSTAIQNIKNFLINAKNAVLNFAQIVQDKFKIVKDWFSGLFDKVDLTPIKNFFSNIQVSFKPLEALGKVVLFILGSLFKAGQAIMPVLFKLGGAIWNFVKGLGTAISKAIGGLDIQNILNIFNTGLIGGLLLAIKKFIDSGSEISENVGSIFGGVTDILDGVKDSLEAWQKNLEAKTLLTLASAVGILAIALVAIASIDSKKLSAATLAMGALFVELTLANASMGKLGGAGLTSSLGLVAMATSLLIISGAITALSKINEADMNRGVGAIYGLTASMIIFSKLMSKNSGSILKGSVGLVAFSVSLLLLTGVVKRLGALDPLTLTNGLIGVGAMLAEIAIFMRIVDKAGVKAGTGLGMIGIAAAILLMSVSVEKFAQMDLGKLQQGLSALGAVLLEIGLFTKLSGNGKGLISTSIGLTIMGAAMLIMVESISRLGNLSWDELGRGLAGMGGSLAIIFAAVKLMPKDMILTGVALVVVASGLVILSNALTTMSGMTWEEIGKGLTALAGSLAILSLGLYAMSGTLAGSFALILAAGALAILAPVLKNLGSMALSELGLALLAMAGAFTVLAIAGYALTPVVPTLLGLAGAVVLFGVAAALVGVGLLAFSAGLAALAVSGVAGAVAIVSMVATILGIIPLVIKSLADALILFAKLIIEATPVVAEAITGLLLAFLQIIIDVSPKLFEALEVLLDGLIKLIIDKIPKFLEAVGVLITELLKLIVSKVPEFIAAGLEILLSFLKGIRDNIGEIVTVAIEIVTNFIDAVAKKLPDIIQSGFNLIVSFINGLADGIRKNGKEIKAAVKNLTDAIIKGFTDGLTSGVGGVVAAIGKLAGAAVTALKKLLGIFSPSRIFTVLGKLTGQGFIDGISKMVRSVGPATEKLGEKAVTGMGKAISQIKDAINTDLDMVPTIRPVVDLTDVISSGKLVDGILGEKTLNLVPSVSKSSLVSTNMGDLGRDINGTSLPGNTSISFEQNNYSPKALSAIEIYRQTKNQLRTLKELAGP